METKSAKLSHPIEIPVIPAYYSFLLQGVCNKKQKKAMLAAINKYNKTCQKAYKQLIKELEKSLAV
jgi:hypothetical protein